MLSIRRLASKHGLSRATLLYYEKLGLLCPSSRSRAGYRLYSAADDARLARICRYRTSGVPVADLRALLEAEPPRVTAALEARLLSISREIAALRRQQRLIIELLGGGAAAARAGLMTREGWVALLESVGVDTDERGAWHRAFEKQSPEAHQEFLESLGLSLSEITEIRAHYGAAPEQLTRAAEPRLRRRAPHERRR